MDLTTGAAQHLVWLCLGGGGLEASQAVVLAVSRDADQESRGEINRGLDGKDVGRRREVHVHSKGGYRGTFFFFQFPFSSFFFPSFFFFLSFYIVPSSISCCKHFFFLLSSSITNTFKVSFLRWASLLVVHVLKYSTSLELAKCFRRVSRVILRYARVSYIHERLALWYRALATSAVLNDGLSSRTYRNPGVPVWTFCRTHRTCRVRYGACSETSTGYRVPQQGGTRTPR